MCVIGVFGGMIYKHFQVNKLRGEVKRYKGQTEYFRSQVDNSDQRTDELIDEVIKYQTYLIEKHGEDVKFVEGGTETTHVGRVSKHTKGKK